MAAPGTRTHTAFRLAILGVACTVITIGLDRLSVVSVPDWRSELVPLPAAGARPDAPAHCGILDCGPSDPDHRRIDDLIRHERHEEGFQLAVEELRAKARERGLDDPATLSALQRVGAIAKIAGDPWMSDGVFDGVLRALRRVGHEDDVLLADTLIWRAQAARALGASGRVYLDEARRILSRHPNDGLRASIEWEEANALKNHDPEASFAHRQRALSLVQANAPVEDSAEILTWMAWSLQRDGRSREAARYARRARDRFESAGIRDSQPYVIAQTVIANELARAGRWKEAEVLYRVIASTAAQARLGHFTGYPRRSFPRDGFDMLAYAALLRGNGTEAWRLMEEGLAAVHRDFAALGSWERVDPAGFAEMRRLREELLLREAALDEDRRAGRSVWEPSTAPHLLRVLEMRAAVLSREARHLRQHGLPAPTLQSVRALLDPHTALVGRLEISVDPDTQDGRDLPLRPETYMYVLRHDRPLQWIAVENERSPSGSPRGADPLVMIQRATTWSEPVAADATLVEELDTWTRGSFDLVLPYLDGIDRIVVEGTEFPFEVFHDAGGRYLLDRFETIYVPSASFLVFLAEREARAPAQAARSILSVSAGPTPDASSSVGGSEDFPSAYPLARTLRASFPRGTDIRALPRLAFAPIETARVASYFPRSTILGGSTAAREIALRARDGRLGGYDVIHLAAHALTHPAAERGALLLGYEGAGEQVLQIEDILLGWDLRAKLVTLSACEAARVTGRIRNEEIGFTPALFAAGARSVLVSIWPVDDHATAILMDRFYRNLTGHRSSANGPRVPGMRGSAALREAKQYVRDMRLPSGERPYEHPAYWAGFLLIGSPDAR